MKTIIGLILVLFFSINAFGQWEECILPENNDSPIYDMIEHNGIYYLTTYEGIYKTTDNGQTWVNIFYDENITIAYLAYSGNTLVGGGNGIYKSYDNGVSWIKAFTLDLEVNGISTSEDEVIIGTNEHIYFSTNNGETWSHITSTFYNINWVSGSLKIADNTYIAQIGGDYLCKSTDGMLTWETISIEGCYPKTKTSGYDKRFLMASNGHIFRYRNTNTGSSQERIIISTDDAESFSCILPDKLKMISQTTSLTEYEEKLYALRFDADNNGGEGLFVSDDFGITWYIVDELDEFSGTYSDPKMLKVYDNYIYISTNGGKIYRKALNSSISEIPNFTFEFNPNPTKEIINIKYEVEQNANIKVSILDIEGNEIIRIAKSNHKKGKYTYNTNVSNLDKGIYILNMQINKKNISKKIIIN